MDLLLSLGIVGVLGTQNYLSSLYSQQQTVIAGGQAWVLRIASPDCYHWSIPLSQSPMLAFSSRIHELFELVFIPGLSRNRGLHSSLCDIESSHLTMELFHFLWIMLTNLYSSSHYWTLGKIIIILFDSMDFCFAEVWADAQAMWAKSRRKWGTRRSSERLQAGWSSRRPGWWTWWHEPRVRSVQEALWKQATVWNNYPVSFHDQDIAAHKFALVFCFLIQPEQLPCCNVADAQGHAANTQWKSDMTGVCIQWSMTPNAPDSERFLHFFLVV